MRTSVTKLLVGVGVLALASGCNCPGETLCGDIFVAFESPRDGATGVPGTTSVSVKVTDNAGQPVELASATLVSRATSATEFSVPRDGTVTSGAATFSGVTLEPGPNLIKVTVTKKGSACTGTKSITVEVPQMNTPPEVLSVSFPQDTAMPTGTLNSVELPTTGMLRVDVNTQNALTGTVEIINTANNMTLRSAPIANSMVSVTFDSAMLADGPYSLFAKVTRGAQSNTQTGNPAAVKTIILARTPPTCMVTAPTATKTIFGPNDDANPTKAGYQLRATGTASSAATGYELKLTGGATLASGALTPTAGTVSFDFDLPSTTGMTTAYTVTIEARDANGNVCTASRMLTTDFEPPMVTLTSPVAAMSPYTSFNIPISANVTGGQGGLATFTTQVGAGMPFVLGPGPLQIGATNVAGTGSFPAGMQTVSVVATDAVGNTSAPVSQVITVNGTGCSVRFVKPATKPAFISSTTFGFQVQTSCPGTAVTLKQDGVVKGTPVNADGTGLASFVVSGLTNTMKTVFRAEAGTPVSFDEVEATIDTSAPAITQPQITGSLTYVLLNKSNDPNPAAGAQATLAFTATIPTGGRADVCSNQVPAVSPTPCADGAAGWFQLQQAVTSPSPSFTFPEGIYQLKIVVVSGGMATAVSTPVDFVVDVTPPVVTAFTLLNDGGDKKYNIAELNGMPPNVSVTFNTGSGPAVASTVLVRDQGNSNTNYNTQAGVMLMPVAAPTSATVALNQGIAPEGNYAFDVLVSDSAGNTSDATIAVAKISGVRIDSVVPTCTVTQPSQTLLGGPDDADGATTGFQLDQQVSTSASDTIAVTFRAVNGAQTQMATGSTSSGTATNRFTLAQPMPVTTYSFGATCTDSAGNATTSTVFAGVVVDLEAPVCSITAPVASPPQYSSFTIGTTIAVTGPGTSNLPVTVYSQQGAGTPQQVGTPLNVSGGVATGPLNYPFAGTQTITAEVTDLAGNKCTTAPVVIDINAMGCSFAITSPTSLPSGRAYFTSTAIAVTGHSSNCGAGKTVTLFNTTGAPVSLGTGSTNASGDVTVMATLAEGGPYSLRLQIDNGAGITTNADLSNVFVDTTPPVVGTVSPSGTTLNFVAAGNANLPNAAYVVDTTPGAPANFQVVLTGITGANGGRVRVLFKTVEIAGQDLSTDPASVNLGVSLPHNDSGNFSIVVTDEAGNPTTSVSATAAIDVIAPDAPSFTQMLTDARAATVSLVISPTYDDAAVVASGAHAGYDIRWTTLNVPNHNALATSTDYFDSAKANPEANTAWSASQITRPVTLPPFNSYYIAVRAKDELGNYSAYVAPTLLANQGTQTFLVNPTGTGSQNYSRNLVSNGSLNADAFDDLVVTASVAAVNRVYVYFGGSTFAGVTTCTMPACQEVLLPGATTFADQFGTDIAVGDVGGSSAKDLIVSSPTFNPGGAATTGRVFIFFGGATPIDTAVFIELRGLVTSGLFGRAAQVIGDIDKDGIGDLAITASGSGEGAGRGRIYIFKGRSVAQWQAARTSMDPVSMAPFIPSSGANWIIEGPTPVTGATNTFGQPRFSIAALGDVNADTFPDFTVGTANNVLNKLFVFSGQTVSAAVAPLTTGVAPTVAENTLAILSQAAGPSSTGAFGAAVLGGRNLIGASGNDMVVAHPFPARLYVWADVVAPIPATTTTTIDGTPSSQFGTSLAVGRIDSDGASPTPDLIVGESPPTGTSFAWIFYNRANAYDSSVGKFWQSSISGPAAGTGAFGASIASGDFNNDGKADIAIGDPSTSPGRVLVWH